MIAAESAGFGLVHTPNRQAVQAAIMMLMILQADSTAARTTTALVQPFAITV